MTSSVQSTAESDSKKSSQTTLKPNVQLVLEAIKFIADRKGATIVAIKKYVLSKKGLLTENQTKIYNANTFRTIKACVDQNLLFKKSGMRYALTEEAKKTSKVKKSSKKTSREKENQDGAKDPAKKKGGINILI